MHRDRRGKVSDKGVIKESWSLIRPTQNYMFHRTFTPNHNSLFFMVIESFLPNSVRIPWGHLQSAQARPALNSPQAWLGLVHLYLLSEPDWNQKLMSSSLQTRHLSAIRPDHISMFPMPDDVPWNASCAWPHPEAEASVAHLHPRTAV